MEKADNLILGGGIAGLSCAFHLKQSGKAAAVFEAQPQWGGLCNNFTLHGFRFDKFVHFSFTENEYVKNIFTSAADYISHKPELSNYYRGFWLKHPAQNNLEALPPGQKAKILFSFLFRNRKALTEKSTYEDWLRHQYGNYFAENFPLLYTRKYWGLPAKELETKWIGKRMRSVTFKEMLAGILSKKQESLYYASNMRYPKKGGFKSFLNAFAQGADIRLNKKAVRIDTLLKTVYFEDGSSCAYNNLISTIPLPDIVKILHDAPPDILKAAQLLRYTCGYMVSVGLKNKNDFGGNLFIYAYDEDLPFSRVYFPSIKSEDNVPPGKSSLQAEIFFANGTQIPPAGQILKQTLKGLFKTGIIKESDILFTDIHFEPYANIIFDANIYTNRQIVLNWLKTRDIIPAGRFGKWEYFWTDQAFLDGKAAAKLAK